MMLGLMTACKGNETDNPENTNNKDGNEPVAAQRIVLEHAYLSENIEIDALSRGYMNFAIAGDRIYYMSTEFNNETDDEGNLIETSGYNTTIESAKIDGSDVQTLWEREFVYPDYNQDVVEYEGVNTFAVDAENNLWLVMNHDVYNQKDNYSESTIRLKKYAPDGTELLDVDISSASSEDYFYPSSMLFNGDGDIVMLSYQTLLVFDGETGEMSFKIEEQNYINSISQTNKGEIVYTAYSSSTYGYVIKKIDFEAKRAGPAIEYTGMLYFNSVANGNGDYSLYVLQEDYIYGFDLETLTEEIIVSFMNSDIDSSNIQAAYSIGEGDFIISSYDWNNSSMELMSLTPNPNPVIEGKALITLGAVYVDTDIKSAIRKFNKSSSTARITLKDYSLLNTPEDYSAGATQLDMDILAGKAPDIISMNQLQPTKYATKGVFEDLLPYLENDPEINKADLFENILEAGMYDGKLYNVISSFRISTLAGKRSIFGDGKDFTASKLLQLSREYPDAEILSTTTADSWLYNCIALAIVELVDWTTGTCDFNSPEFIALLETSRLFPETIDYDALYADYEVYRKELETTFIENRTLLRSCDVSRIREARSITQMFGEEITYVGYPTASGGAALIHPSTSCGVSATSPYKDEAWEFIKLLINTDMSSGMRWVQSIKRSVFDEEAAEEMIPLWERDFEKGVDIFEVYADGSASGWTINSPNEVDREEYKDYALTQQEVDTARAVIESATRVYTSDETIQTIISEEIASFISGAKTAEQVAQLIQSRVSLYVSENM